MFVYLLYYTFSDGKGGMKKRKSVDSKFSVFDVDKNSGKQLRHYKYILINFISTLLATPSFIDMVCCLLQF